MSFLSFSVTKIGLSPQELSDTTNKKFGLHKNGKAQQYVDSEVLRHCDRLIPFRTGNARNSGKSNTVIGSGKVKWRTPYIRTIYYADGRKFNGYPHRGARWFERMKTLYGEEIVSGVKKIVRGD